MVPTGKAALELAVMGLAEGEAAVSLPVSDYQLQLAVAHMTISMSRSANCWDNAIKVSNLILPDSTRRGTLHKTVQGQLALQDRS